MNFGRLANQARGGANNPEFRKLARFGYVARGTVYIIIGVLALLAALDKGGATTDRNGAVQTIYQQTGGRVLLIVLGVGFLGYAAWKFASCLFDTEKVGEKPKGWLKRAGYFLIGLSYTGLALTTFQLALSGSSNGKSSDQSAQDWTARFMEQPFGVPVIICAGLVVLGMAVAQFYQAATMKFKKKLELGKLDGNRKRMIESLGRFGFAARGVVFGIIGLFLILAALSHNPQQARGLGGALQELSAQTFGQILLGIVAFGFIAFGIFSFFQARYHRFGYA